MTRILLTGGGTGGHLYPLLAVAEELKNRSELVYLGINHPLNREFDSLEIPVFTLASSKFRRYFSLLNIVDFFKFFFSLGQALVKILKIRPHIIFSKGGPGALPVVIVAWAFQIPIYIHESDAIPGLVNKISGHFARKIFTSFEIVASHFPKKKVILTGNPIRRELISLANRETKESAKRNLGFSVERLLITVLGGSQGSARINKFIFENLSVLTETENVFHQLGKENIHSVTQIESLNQLEHSSKYHWVGFLDTEGVARVLTASDIVISRAGAGSIFETALFERPSILIPLKGSAGEHQIKNAREYEQAGACEIIEEDDLNIKNLAQKIKEVLSKAPEVGERAKQFAKPNAAQEIAKSVTSNS